MIDYIVYYEYLFVGGVGGLILWGWDSLKAYLVFFKGPNLGFTSGLVGFCKICIGYINYSLNLNS